MTFSDFNSHTNQLCIDLKILKVRNIIDLQQLQLVYDFYDNRLPKHLKNLFTFSSDIHTTNFKLQVHTKISSIFLASRLLPMAINPSNFTVQNYGMIY